LGCLAQFGWLFRREILVWALRRQPDRLRMIVVAIACWGVRRYQINYSVD